MRFIVMPDTPCREAAGFGDEKAATAGQTKHETQDISSATQEYGGSGAKRRWCKLKADGEGYGGRR